MASDVDVTEPRNLLPRTAAIGGVLLGLMLAAGAYGHIFAVWSMIDANRTLLLPALSLAFASLINIALCPPLWVGEQWAVTAALIANAAATGYLVYLLLQGVPNHPIGFFVALVSSHVVVLGAVRAGLVWPAVRAAT
ncbi:MAG: hypothetical protein AAF270_10455 [Pseudomonadota bacterium]